MSSQASRCFQFEHDFVGSWRCIPLCVRRKLDLIGLKLKLSHWLELNQQQRQELVGWPDEPPSLASLRAHLLSCTAAMADGKAKPLAPAQGEAWQQANRIPAEVSRATQERGYGLDLLQWGALDEIERFALCKLARPGHDHQNLDAALLELLDPKT